MKTSLASPSLNARRLSGFQRWSIPMASWSFIITVNVSSGWMLRDAFLSPPKPSSPNWFARVARSVMLPSTLRPAAPPSQSLVAAR